MKYIAIWSILVFISCSAKTDTKDKEVLIENSKSENSLEGHNDINVSRESSNLKERFIFEGHGGMFVYYDDNTVKHCDDCRVSVKQLLELRSNPLIATYTYQDSILTIQKNEGDGNYSMNPYEELDFVMVDYLVNVH
jgi:hypothetical protein